MQLSKPTKIFNRFDIICQSNTSFRNATRFQSLNNSTNSNDACSRVQGKLTRLNITSRCATLTLTRTLKLATGGTPNHTSLGGFTKTLEKTKTLITGKTLFNNLNPRIRVGIIIKISPLHPAMGRPSIRTNAPTRRTLTKQPVRTSIVLRQTIALNRLTLLSNLLLACAEATTLESLCNKVPGALSDRLMIRWMVETNCESVSLEGTSGVPWNLETICCNSRSKTLEPSASLSSRLRLERLLPATSGTTTQNSIESH